MSGKPKVAVLLGSKSDIPHMESCLEFLDRFGIQADLKILSAHRQPEEVASFASGASDEGYETIIAAAGLAAHLPGTVASRTMLPVIGVPVAAGSLNGLDALLSMVQMPAGVPVATVTLGSAGGRNAAVLAAQILALKYPEVQERLAEYRRSLKA